MDTFYDEQLEYFIKNETSLEARNHELQKLKKRLFEVCDYYDNYLTFCSTDNFFIKCKLFGLYKFKTESVFYQLIKDRARAGESLFLDHYGYNDNEILKLVYDNCKTLSVRLRAAKCLNICVDSEIFQLGSDAPFKEIINIYPDNVSYIRFALEKDLNQDNYIYYLDRLKCLLDEQEFYKYCNEFMLRADIKIPFREIIGRYPNKAGIQLALEKDLNQDNYGYYFELLKCVLDEQELYTYCNEFMLRTDIKIPFKEIINIYPDNVSYIRFALEKDLNQNNCIYYLKRLKCLLEDEQEFYKYCNEFMLRTDIKIPFREIIGSYPENKAGIYLALEKDLDHDNYDYYFVRLKISVLNEQELYIYFNEFVTVRNINFATKLHIMPVVSFQLYDTFVSNYIINNNTDNDYHTNVHCIFRLSFHDGLLTQRQRAKYKKQYLPFANNKVDILTEIYVYDNDIKKAVNNREIEGLTEDQYVEILRCNGFGPDGKSIFKNIEIYRQKREAPGGIKN